jgi:pyruvate kinase
VGARVLVAFTATGSTPRRISKARPHVPIVAFANAEEQVRPLALYWGVVPRTIDDEVTDVELLVRRVSEALVEQKLVVPGDRFVMAFGAPLGQGMTTNALRVVEIST